MCFSLEVSIAAFFAAVSVHVATIWTCVESPVSKTVAWERFLAVSSGMCFACFMQLAEALGHMTLDNPYRHSLAGALGYILNMLQPAAATASAVYVLVFNGSWTGSAIVAIVSGATIAVSSIGLFMFSEDRTIFLFKYRPVRFPLAHQSYSIQYSWFKGGETSAHWSATWIKVLYFTCLGIPYTLLLTFALFSDETDSTFRNFCKEAVFLSFSTLLLCIAAEYMRSDTISSGSVWCLSAVPTLFYLDLAVVKYATNSSDYANTLFLVATVAVVVGLLLGFCLGGTKPHRRNEEVQAGGLPLLSVGA